MSVASNSITTCTYLAIYGYQLLGAGSTGRAKVIIFRLQAYVRPTEHPQLDPFCRDLTGIQQHQVDRAEPLQRVLQHHHEWLQEQGLLQPEVQFVPVTWTEWDLKVQSRQLQDSQQRVHVCGEAWPAACVVLCAASGCLLFLHLVFISAVWMPKFIQLRSISKNIVNTTCRRHCYCMVSVVMQIALCTECTWRRIQRPDYLCSWIDLKKYFTERFKRGGNLRSCVEAAGKLCQRCRNGRVLPFPLAASC